MPCVIANLDHLNDLKFLNRSFYQIVQHIPSIEVFAETLVHRSMDFKMNAILLINKSAIILDAIGKIWRKKKIK